MPVFDDITGVKFNRLTAVEYKGRSKWLFLCECGKEIITNGSDVRNGKSKSCGCLAKEILTKRNITHGMTDTVTFKIWRGMRQRCENPNNHAYTNYGGRGIKVCERWAKFENFLADMGERPGGMSIDRIDVSGDYEPSNCRWATRAEQARNTTRNRYVEIDGENLTITDWEVKMKLNKSVICKRIIRGVDPKLAVLTPAQPGKKLERVV